MRRVEFAFFAVIWAHGLGIVVALGDQHIAIDSLLDKVSANRVRPLLIQSHVRGGVSRILGVPADFKSGAAPGADLSATATRLR
jgi:hypothetical protein